jgi:hypothetical protein
MPLSERLRERQATELWLRRTTSAARTFQFLSGVHILAMTDKAISQVRSAHFTFGVAGDFSSSGAKSLNLPL